MSWGRDSMYSKFCANKLNSHISKDNHMAASQQVSQLHFLYSFQTVPLCELTCIRVYCTVDFDFFTCVFVELYQFMLCNMTVPVLSPLLSVFLSLSWSALCSPPPPPHLLLYVCLCLSLPLHFHLVDCHHRCCHALIPNTTRRRWVIFFCWHYFSSPTVLFNRSNVKV